MSHWNITAAIRRLERSTPVSRAIRSVYGKKKRTRPPRSRKDDFHLLLAAWNDDNRGAHRNLVEITGVDFDKNFHYWTEWYEANQERSREEWAVDSLCDYGIILRGIGWKETFDKLIENLVHDSLRVRTQSYYLLRLYSNRKTPFNAMSKTEVRQRARDRWADWWNRAGKRHINRLKKKGIDPLEPLELAGPRPELYISCNTPEQKEKKLKDVIMARMNLLRAVKKNQMDSLPNASIYMLINLILGCAIAMFTIFLIFFNARFEGAIIVLIGLSLILALRIIVRVKKQRKIQRRKINIETLEKALDILKEPDGENIIYKLVEGKTIEIKNSTKGVDKRQLLPEIEALAWVTTCLGKYGD